MKILHISDIHAQPGQPLAELAAGIAAILKKRKQQPQYLVATGDFGLKGAGAKEGVKLVRFLADKLLVPNERIVCCPGNHEIEPGGRLDRFSEYFEAVTILLGDGDRAKPVPCGRHSTFEADFLILNSAYHHEHQHGAIHLGRLREELARLPESPSTRTRIAVVHHHSIPFSADDQSHIQNAYEFLQLIGEHQFELLLHGHRHMALRMSFGPRPTNMIGVGTVNFPPGRNVNNQFNLIDIGKTITRYRYLADMASPAGSGAWEPKEEGW